MSGKISQKTITAAAGSSIESVAFRLLGSPIPGKTKPHKMVYSCPKCQVKAKLEIITSGPKEGIYKCFGCDWGGKGPIKLVQDLTPAIDYPEAIKMVCDINNIIVEFDEPTQTNGKTNKKKAAVSVVKGKGSEKGVDGHRATPNTAVSQAQPAKALTYEKAPAPDRKAKGANNTFLLQQLAASGLEVKDINYRLKRTDGSTESFARYTQGTPNEFWEVNHDGPDLILHYLDLNGGVMMHKPERSKKLVPFFRVRYQTPENHRDKKGKPKKYDQPWGSTVKVWFPNPIITAYANGTPIDTLYVIEGEKKADKQTKHGMMTVGITGIFNLIQSGQLPAEFEQIIRKCDVKRVVFCVDGDLFDIKYTPGEAVDYRSRGFFRASVKFRDYFGAFRNHGLHLDIFLAHPKPELKHKGVDDLIVNTPELATLFDEQHPLKADYQRAFTDGNHTGQWIQAYNITTLSESKIQELWHLQSMEAFVEFHRAKLEEICTIADAEGNMGLKGTFHYGKVEYNFNDEGEPEMTSPLKPEESFIEEVVKGNKKTEAKTVTLEWKYEKARKWLAKRGYYNYQNQANKRQFIHIDNKIVRALDIAEPQVEMQRAVLAFVRDEVQKEDWLELIHKGKSTYLSAAQLAELPFIKPDFVTRDKFRQYLHFKNGSFEITADDIRHLPFTELNGCLWEEEIKDFEPARLATPLLTFNGDIARPRLTFSEEAFKCDYLMFLCATSWIGWETFMERNRLKPEHRTIDFVRLMLRNMQGTTPDYLNDEEYTEFTLHLLNKLSGLGYLLHRYRDFAKEKMVIGMDAKESMVGESSGRSGKSLIGRACEQVVPVAYIDGKKPDLETSPFLFERVTESTAIIFMDDVRANVNMERFFTAVTGKIEVNKKNLASYTTGFEDNPKFYVTTNHSFNGMNPSMRARMFNMAFADWYTADHAPIDDFGKSFFQDWEYDAWNGFYNLMAECLHLYFKYNLIECPQEQLERRRQRQFIGEEYLAWFLQYFDADGNNINRRIRRPDMFDDCINSSQQLKRYVNQVHFLKKLKACCDYTGLEFNPHRTDDFGKKGAMDKAGGVEFFVIANSDFDIQKMSMEMGVPLVSNSNNFNVPI